MPAATERPFNSTKLIITDERCRLRDEVVCAIDCLKSWSRVGLVERYIGNLYEILEALYKENEQVEKHGKQ